MNTDQLKLKPKHRWFQTNCKDTTEEWAGPFAFMEQAIEAGAKEQLECAGEISTIWIAQGRPSTKAEREEFGTDWHWWIDGDNTIPVQLAEKNPASNWDYGVWVDQLRDVAHLSDGQLARLGTLIAHRLRYRSQASKAEPNPQQKTRKMDKETAQTLAENLICIEYIGCLGGLWTQTNDVIFENIVDKSIDWDTLIQAGFTKKELKKICEDESYATLTKIIRKKQLTGFLVIAAIPDPNRRNGTRIVGGKPTHSPKVNWDISRFNWFFGNTLDETIPKILAWKDEMCAEAHTFNKFQAATL